MESHIFNPSNAIYILNFLQKFKRSCNNLGINEVVTVSLFVNFMTDSAKTDVFYPIEEEEYVDEEAINYLFET